MLANILPKILWDNSYLFGAKFFAKIIEKVAANMGATICTQIPPKILKF